MESMIERVARAMREELGVDWHYSGHDELVDVARAAIKEMRRPTEWMITIGACHEDQDHHIFDEGHIAQEVWAAMIDAALEPKP